MAWKASASTTVFGVITCTGFCGNWPIQGGYLIVGVACMLLVYARDLITHDLHRAVTKRAFSRAAHCHSRICDSSDTPPPLQAS